MHDRIFQDIEAELEYARKKWGTDFDSKNTLNDWAAYTNIYLGNATRMNNAPEQTRAGLIKAAGLLVSAIEHFDAGTLAKRHYDK